MNFYLSDVEHMELVDRIYLAVRKMIFDRELEPGQKLVQEKLAERLGVSRSPLLKALQRLESELLVESIPRRGMYVRELGPGEIRDVFECRSVIEGLSARLAAERASKDNITELAAIFGDFLADAPIDAVAYARADRRFHHRILELSGNSVIGRLENLTNIHLIAFQAGLLRPPSETLPEHIAILEAIQTGDGRLAERRMREHIERSSADM